MREKYIKKKNGRDKKDKQIPQWLKKVSMVNSWQKWDKRRIDTKNMTTSLKVIPYVSPGYLDVRNPIYRKEWSRGAEYLVEIYYNLDMLCPGSPGWRAYFFNVVDRLMDVSLLLIKEKDG